MSRDWDAASAAIERRGSRAADAGGTRSLSAARGSAGGGAQPSLGATGIFGDVLAGATATLHDPRLRSILIEFNWTAGAPQTRRDTPLLDAGFALDSLGNEYEHGEVRWQNAIYRRDGRGIAS
ncbi:MAG: hypothetical protein ACREMY_10280 [bacterium]